ncbi:hypothetical protein BN874_200057 [Candidatus Contendobacter odensis Run_B_J11]|uniref:Uncharacterized protein n=1 Tax=Candidatus Contendobacter odensis Run_B_J11 TaxID=1400861 RepID=A0A7U7J484_9GAMM|nr:hypothetical protein BN874_200057 [Candidatus Contendobacter odensis Run_B_J11]
MILSVSRITNSGLETTDVKPAATVGLGMVYSCGEPGSIHHSKPWRHIHETLSRRGRRPQLR